MNFYRASDVGVEYVYISIIFFIITFSLGNIFIFKTIKERKLRAIVILGFLIRFFLIIKDNFIEYTTFSTADGVLFNTQGYRYLMGYKYLNFSFIKLIVGPIYTLFQMQVPSVISCLNLMASLGTTLILYRMIKRNIYYQEENIKKIMLIYSFSVFTIFLNIAFLREGILVFCGTLYIYYYLEYRKRKKYLLLGVGIFFLLISTYLHSGMIFLGTIPLYEFYRKSKGMHKVIALGIVGVILIVGVSAIKDMSYFRGRNLEEMVKGTKAALTGKLPGSIYISKVTSIKDFILTSPVRYFYFLFSPTPNFWRGSMDIFAFFANSSIYIYLIGSSLKNYLKIKRRIKRRDRVFIESLMIGMFVTTFVYGMGTTTAGTAIRHRDKILPVLLITYCIIIDKKRLINYENSNSQSQLRFWRSRKTYSRHGSRIV